MISNLANLVRWEWFKLYHRWMPWVLLVILLLFSQLPVWGSFFGYQTAQQQPAPEIGFRAPGGPETTISCRDLLDSDPADLPPDLPPSALESCQEWESSQQAQLQQVRDGFTLPGSLAGALGIAHFIGLLLISILAASVIGTEYAWGTLRTSLVRGSGRWQFLAAKLGMLTLLGGAALVVVVLLSLASSALAGSLAGGDATSSPEGSGWVDAAVLFGKSWFGLLPYIALATAVTVLTGSSAAGIGISLAYNFSEEIGVAILINVFGWFETFANYLLGRNVTAWLSDGGGGIAFGGAIGELPGQWHALFVLLAYMAVLGGLAFWLFLRRDIKGASGG